MISNVLQCNLRILALTVTLTRPLSPNRPRKGQTQPPHLA